MIVASPLQFVGTSHPFFLSFLFLFYLLVVVQEDWEQGSWEGS